MCAAHFLSHPAYPLDLLTCHSQVHLVAFRPPNHPHFNLCWPLYSCFRGSEREAFCVHALDVMQGKWWIEPVWWPRAANRERKAPIWKWLLRRGVGWVFVMLYVTPPSTPPLSPRLLTGYWLNRNWTRDPIIALHRPSGLIQGLVLNVCWGQLNRWVEGDKDGKGQHPCIHGATLIRILLSGNTQTCVKWQDSFKALANISCAQNPQFHLCHSYFLFCLQGV